MSKDSVKAQKAFARKNGLTFHLLADEASKVIKAYGVAGFFGYAKRCTFLIDSKGRVAKILDDVNAPEHAAEVAEALLGVA